MKTLLTTTALALALAGPATTAFAESHVAAEDSAQANDMGAQLEQLGIRATDLIGKRLYMQVSTDDMDSADASDEMSEEGGMSTEMAEGDMAAEDGDMAEEDMAEGDMTEEDGDMAEQDMAEGDMAEEDSDAMESEMAEGDAAEAEEEQEAEMADTEVGEAAEEVEAEVAEAGENIEGAAEEAGDEIAEAGEAVENTAEEAGDEMAEAGEEMESAASSMTSEITDIPEDWESVGDINDLVVGEDGEIRGIIVDAGGFLGMGETQKRIDMADLQFVSDSDDEGEFYVVYTGDQSTFEEQVDYDEEAAAEQGEMRATEFEGMQEDFAANDGEAEMVDWTNVSTDELLGTRVYSNDNEWVGDLSELVLADDGNVQAAIIDVGGFLGIGEKPVEMSLEQVELRRTNGGSLRAYVSASEEELDQMPRWED